MKKIALFIAFCCLIPLCGCQTDNSGTHATEAGITMDNTTEATTEATTEVTTEATTEATTEVTTEATTEPIVIEVLPTLTVMQYNIAGYAADSSEEHKSGIKTMLEHYTADIVVLNEADDALYTDNPTLGEHYANVTCNFGGTASGAVILYNREAVEFQTSATLCLSDTPMSYSKVSLSYHYRFVTLAKFKELSSGTVFYLLATHLENNSTNQDIFERRNAARILQARALLSIISSSIPAGAPIILAGDLNGSENREDVYREGGITQLLESGLFVNSVRVAEKADIAYSHVSGISFDHILVSPDKFTVKRFTVGDELPNGITNPSDHYPIISEIEFKK